jgi:hypothetical protein
MNKLKEALQRDNRLYTSYSVRNKDGKFTSVCSIEKSKELTTDVAIKFAEWIADTKIHGYSKQLYEAMIVHKVKTTQELFEEFINNHYGK